MSIQLNLIAKILSINGPAQHACEATAAVSHRIQLNLEREGNIRESRFTRHLEIIMFGVIWFMRMCNITTAIQSSLARE